MQQFIAAVLAIVMVATPALAGSKSFSKAIEDKASADRFSGVILISEGKRIRFHAAFGEADITIGAKMRTDSTFRIASITKLFTAAIVLDLVEDGVLRLDDPIAKRLHDFPGEGADKVTLRQLLNHTSGLRQFDTVTSYQQAFAMGIPQYQRPLTAADLMALCCGGALAREPGSSFEYNNADYIVLGRIIEEVTGKSFSDALAEHIIAPLHLAHTGMMSWEHSPKGIASTYFFRDDTGKLVNDMPVYWENWYAAGGMYSNADDLRVFASALFGGRLFDKKLVETLLTPGLDEYGLGLWSYSFDAAGKKWRVAKRSGRIMGANAVLYRLLDLDVTIVLLANTNQSDLDVFAQEVAENLIENGRR